MRMMQPVQAVRCASSLHPSYPGRLVHPGASHVWTPEQRSEPMPDTTSAPIEIYAIGTELVLGRIQDTNSYWMAQRISALGGDLRRVTQLVDDLDQIVEALADSLARGTRVI